MQGDIQHSDENGVKVKQGRFVCFYCEIHSIMAHLTLRRNTSSAQVKMRIMLIDHTATVIMCQSTKSIKITELYPGQNNSF